jgi:hypothetical protein
MAYGKDDFIADCRKALKERGGDAAREAICTSMKKLLKNEDFIAEHLGPDQTGFNLLFHVFDHANGSPPHDHGASWAVYGQAVGHTDMTEWEYDEAADKLNPVKEYRLKEGEAGIYPPHAIHSIEYNAGARFVRVTGVDLATVTRRVFDQDTHEMRTQESNGAGFTAQQS